MDIKLQKFTEVGKRFENRITITRNRAIGFPTQFSKENSLKEYSYAVLFYDNTSGIIGIKFTKDASDQGAVKINHSKDYGGHLIATSFFKANRINTKKYSGRYDYKKRALRDVGVEEDGDVFIIELKDNKKSDDGGDDM